MSKGVLTPENATLKAEASISNALGNKSVMVVMVHKVGKDAHCNIGIVTNGVFESLIDQKIIKNTEPSKHQLIDTLNRLESAKRNEIEGSLRLKTAFSFLSTNVSDLFH